MENLTDEDLDIPPCKYEYLDHTADIQFHAWGETMQEAFEQVAMAMFAYMTEIETVEIKQSYDIKAQADDLEGLLYHFLDELLYMFSVEPYLIAKKVKILEFDAVNYKIEARAYGEEFTIGKHPQGAEVKAITYSAMQILDRPKADRPEIFVIVDI